jgi:hypothetical protein
MALNSVGGSASSSKKSLWGRIRASLAASALVLSGIASGQEASKTPDAPDLGGAKLTEQIKARAALDLRLAGSTGKQNIATSVISANESNWANSRAREKAKAKELVSYALGMVGVEGSVGERNGKNTLGLKVGKEWNESVAVVWEIVVGKTHREALINLGFKVGEDATLVVTHQNLKQLLTHNFALGTSGASATVTDWASQATTGITWKYVNTREIEKLLQSYSVSVYQTKSQGQDFGTREYNQTNAGLYELYEQALRTNGVTRTGASLNTGLQITPNLQADVRAGVVAQTANTFVPGSREVSPSAGLTLNYQVDPKNSLATQIDTSKFGTNGSLKWTRSLSSNTTMSLEGYASRPQIGETNRGVKFTLNIAGNLDGMGSKSAPTTSNNGRTLQPRQSLLATTSQSPFYRAMGVEVAVDRTVKPVLLVNIDSNGLPTGSTIDASTGNISYPAPSLIGTFVSALNTVNGAPIPASIFSLNNGIITIQTRALTPFLVAGTQTIAATFTGGVLNIVAEKGSIKITSITFTPNAPVILPIPAAPTAGEFACDDATNLCTPAPGVNIALYEVSMNGWAYGPIVPTALYPELQTLRFRLKAVAGVSQAGSVLVVNFTPSAPVLTGQNLSYSFAYGTEIVIPAPVATDADGGVITPIFTNDPTNPVTITMDALGVITVAPTTPAGSYILKRRVRDASGLISANEEIFTVVIGLIVPVAPVGLTANNASNTITYPSGFNLAAHEISNDGGSSWSAINAFASFVGNQTVLIRQKAAVGVSSASPAASFVFTEAAPIFVTNPVNITVLSGNAASGVIATATDPDGDTITTTLLPGTSAIPAGFSLSGLNYSVSSTTPIGVYNLQMSITDGKNPPVVRAFTLTVGALPAGAIPTGITSNDTSNTITYPSGFNLAAHEISNDGGSSWAAINPSTSFVGNQTVLIRQKAVAGVSSASPAVSFVFTNGVPVISASQITSLTLNEWVAGSIPVLLATDVDGDNVVMSVSGFPAGISLVGGNITVASTLIPGVYSGNIIASDGSTTTSQPVTITIQAVAPAAPTGLALNTPALTNNPQPTLSWGVVAGATSYSVRINGGAWINVGNVTSYQLPIQADGAKTLQVQANRVVGATTLTSAASASVGVTIDTVAPTLSSVSLADWDGNFGTAGTAIFSMNKPIAMVTSISMKFTTGSNTGSIVPGIVLVSNISGSQVAVTTGPGSLAWTIEGVRIEITGVDVAGNSFTVTTVAFGIA